MSIIYGQEIAVYLFIAYIIKKNKTFSTGYIIDILLLLELLKNGKFCRHTKGSKMSLIQPIPQ